MDVMETKIPEVKVLRPKKFGDHRGFFSETYNKRTLQELGLKFEFVQDNHSVSAEKGTLRGLHFQSNPFAQTKLVRVPKGAILDVAVDIRRGSPTYGEHVAVVIDGEGWNQILVPRGFAHALLTLVPDTEVIYKVDNYYSPEHDKGVIFDDPDLGIDWPLPADELVLSDKDRKQPRFKELPAYFHYEG